MCYAALLESLLISSCTKLVSYCQTSHYFYTSCSINWKQSEARMGHIYLSWHWYEYENFMKQLSLIWGYILCMYNCILFIEKNGSRLLPYIEYFMCISICTTFTYSLNYTSYLLFIKTAKLQGIVLWSHCGKISSRINLNEMEEALQNKNWYSRSIKER